MKDLNLTALMAEAHASFTHPRGPYGRLCDLELGRGFKLVKVGANWPFSVLVRDWIETGTVIARDGKEARIVLCSAKKPGTGAFTRLIANIKRADYTPVVIAPVGPTMPAILAHWGWVKTDIGVGFLHEEQWRAP